MVGVLRDDDVMVT